MDSSEILYELKSEYITPVRLLKNSLIAMFSSICVGAVAVLCAASWYLDIIEQVSIGLIAFVIAFVAVLLLFHVYEKSLCEENSYEIYKTHLKFVYKSIKFKDIKKMELRRELLQKKYGLGTIVLFKYPQWVYLIFGFRIKDIKNPEQVYAQIKELVEKQKELHESQELSSEKKS